MELKRYVLNQKNEIIDVNKHTEKVEIVDDNNLMFINSYGWRFDGKCIKSSDNILDLVEKDDIIEHYQYGKMFVEYKYYSEDYNELHVNDYNVSYGTIAIWKKQPNGDYKRYEVGK